MSGREIGKKTWNPKAGILAPALLVAAGTYLGFMCHVQRLVGSPTCLPGRCENATGCDSEASCQLRSTFNEQRVVFVRK